jgi:hypothetical protein
MEADTSMTKPEHWSQPQWRAADEAGRASLGSEPRATSVRYDETTGKVEVDLSNGCAFSFPAGLVQGLSAASQQQLARVKTLGIGFALEWEDLDVQVTLGGLMAGVFGTKRYMAELARQAGRTRSAAKTSAAKINGAKGGRPRKAITG